MHLLFTERIIQTLSYNEYSCISQMQWQVKCSTVSVAKWANTLSEPQYLLGLTGWWPGFKSRSGREFSLGWANGRYAMRLISRTGTECPPVSSLNRDRCRLWSYDITAAYKLAYYYYYCCCFWSRLSVCLSSSCSNFWKPWPRNFIVGTQVHLENIHTGFVCQANWVKFKVTETKTWYRTIRP